MTLPLSGSIGLVNVKGLVGDLITVGERLDGSSAAAAAYDHAFVLVSDNAPERGGSSVIQAEPGGAKLSPLSQYSGREVLWLPCPPENSRAVVQAAVSYTGIPYAYADYFAIAAHRLGFNPRRLIAQITVSRHMICSQLATAAATKGDWVLFPSNPWTGYITPAMLAALDVPGKFTEVLP